jgi:hypothetical protein
MSKISQWNNRRVILNVCFLPYLLGMPERRPPKTEEQPGSLTGREVLRENPLAASQNCSDLRFVRRNRSPSALASEGGCPTRSGRPEICPYIRLAQIDVTASREGMPHFGTGLRRAIECLNYRCYAVRSCRDALRTRVATRRFSLSDRGHSA